MDETKQEIQETFSLNTKLIWWELHCLSQFTVYPAYVDVGPISCLKGKGVEEIRYLPS